MKNRWFTKEEFTEGLDMKALQISGILICLFAGFMCVLNLFTKDTGVAAVNGMVFGAWHYLYNS